MSYSDKWCPFARHSFSKETAANRWGSMDNPEQCRCIGPQCAVWNGKYCGLAHPVLPIMAKGAA